MTATLWFGLLLQVAAIGIMVVAFRRRTLRQIGPYFVVSAAIYHGVTELWQHYTGRFSTSRGITTQYYIDKWTVTVGLAMIAFSIGYVAVVNFRRRTPALEDNGPAVRRVLTILNWKILGLLCVPLTAVVGTSAFRIGDQTGLAPVDTSALVSLAAQFLVTALALAAISFIVEHPKHVLLPILIQLGVTALIGSRLAVLTGALTTVFGLGLIGRFPSPRRVATSLIAVLILVVSISTARSHIGRAEFQKASLTSRISLLGSGAVAAIEGKPGTQEGQAQPFGERIDGNSFPAAITQAQAAGASNVGLATLGNDFDLAIPSILNPAKLDSSLQDRSEKAYLADHFSVLILTDFLPTQLGTLVGYYGPVGLLGVALLLAALIGLAERILRNKLTPSRLILTLALFTCAASYEQPMTVYPIEFRGAIAVVFIVFVIDRLRTVLQKDRELRVSAHAATS